MDTKDLIVRRKDKMPRGVKIKLFFYFLWMGIAGWNALFGDEKGFYFFAGIWASHTFTIVYRGLK